MSLRIGNPALNENAFDRAARETFATGTMTVTGAITKTAFLLAVCLVAASVTWGMVADASRAAAQPFMIGGLIGGLILGLVISFAPRTAPWASPLYAAAEGLFLGGLSAFFNARYPGIAGAALLVTFGAAAAVLGLWRVGFVRSGGIVMKVVSVATVGIGVAYLISMLMSLFGFGGLSVLNSATPLGIAISVGICIVASLNLVWDFEFIDSRAKAGAPKALEWYAAFGVLVTLVWMYIEILKLMAKLQRRR